MAWLKMILKAKGEEGKLILGRFFLYGADKFLVDFTLGNFLALPPADFNMNFRSPFPFVTDKVAHDQNSSFGGKMTYLYLE